MEDCVEPVVVQFSDVTAAAYRIKKGVKETPLEVRNQNCKQKLRTVVSDHQCNDMLEISQVIWTARDEYIFQERVQNANRQVGYSSTAYSNSYAMSLLQLQGKGCSQHTRTPDPGQLHVMYYNYVQIDLQCKWNLTLGPVRCPLSEVIWEIVSLIERLSLIRERLSLISRSVLYQRCNIVMQTDHCRSKRRKEWYLLQLGTMLWH